MAVPNLCYQQLLGQEKAKKMIHRALAAGRLPHAFVFRGPDGVGKGLFARGLAAALNCRKTDRTTACGICVSCRKYLSRNHPDFQVILPEKTSITIDQIRGLTADLDYPPFESQVRVIVLEDVHIMRREAANSLLKTLEEPPSHNLLILTADSTKEILPTLSSRCQLIPFTSLSLGETTDILVQKGIDRDSAKLFSRLAEGSPGRAMMLHKQDMISLLKGVISCLVQSDGEQASQISELLLVAEKMSALKDDLPILLGLLKLWLRDLLLAEAETILVYYEEGIPLKSWCSHELFAKLQAIARAEDELARNCNKNLVCEVLLFKLLQ